MKWLLLFYLAFFCTIGSAQTGQKKKSTGGTKYVFIMVGVSEPEYDAELTKQMNMMSSSGTYKNYYKSNVVHYSSEIMTISNFNEEKKYRLIDKVRSEVYDEYVRYSTPTMDAEQTKKSIVSANAFVYNTYKEASMARSGEGN